MNNLLHRDSDFQEDTEDTTGGRGDREITLGTTMILAIFFALAVFAAIFFGFGYSMGSKRSAAVAVGAAVPSGPGVSVGTAKPAAGSPADSGVVGQSTLNLHGAQPAVPAASTAAAKHPPATPMLSQPASGAPALPAASQPVVQIAAVSHQQDADLLVSTLKRRGYTVAVRSDPKDKLLHVQVGPFSTRQDAEAMRQRLIADGFNAMVKDPSR